MFPSRSLGRRFLRPRGIYLCVCDLRPSLSCWLPRAPSLEVQTAHQRPLTSEWDGTGGREARGRCWEGPWVEEACPRGSAVRVRSEGACG